MSGAATDRSNEVEYIFPDHWLALSCLQKSIRRGLVGPAAAAAEYLWIEPSRLLDKLLVIVIEDIGIGDLELLCHILELMTDTSWRRSFPDKGRGVVCDLVVRMCAATKNRFTDDVMAIAGFEPALNSQRDKLQNAPDERLRDFLAGSRDIGLRALAAWLLAGDRMEFYPRRPRNRPAVWQTYLDLGVPENLLTLLERAARRLPRPIASLLPLGYLSATKSATIQINSNLADEMWTHIPLPALDQFTRRGRLAIDRWVKSTPELHQILYAGAQRTTWPTITRYVVFAVEGQLCTRHLIWAEQEAALQRSMHAALTGRGLAAEYVYSILEVARTNLSSLNTHRREVLDETT
jgi:hypothetical protein